MGIRYCFVFFLFVFASCTSKEAIESSIPEKYTGVTKIDLSRVKAKLVSWELIKKYLLSDGERKGMDFSVDTDRPAYLCHDNELKNIALFFPLDDAKDFEATMEKIAVSEIVTFKEYKRVEIEPVLERFKYIEWNKGTAVLSTGIENIVSGGKEVKNKQVLELMEQEHDVSSIVYLPLDSAQNFCVRQQTDFEEGFISMVIDADENVKEYVGEQLFTDVSDKGILCFSTDSCVLGLSTKVDPKLLSNLVGYGLPYFQQYGVLFYEQFDHLKPYLDGRVYLGLSQLKIDKGVTPQSKLVFGVSPEYRATLDSTDLLDMKLSATTDYFSDAENFQFILPQADYVIYSNHEESNTKMFCKPTLLNFKINTEFVQDELYSYSRSLLGTERVDQFPFMNIELDLYEKETHLEGEIIIKCKDQERNSLQSILTYFEFLNNKEEI